MVVLLFFYVIVLAGCDRQSAYERQRKSAENPGLSLIHFPIQIFSFDRNVVPLWWITENPSFLNLQTLLQLLLKRKARKVVTVTVTV
ncbi:hypothetical protein SAMN04487852_112107 [Prevotella sp. tf2-5]|nr:hypothetical protein SAMN04487852_112107 [Prevotella sp. tf2-5]